MGRRSGVCVLIPFPGLWVGVESWQRLEEGEGRPGLGLGTPELCRASFSAREEAPSSWEPQASPRQAWLWVLLAAWAPQGGVLMGSGACTAVRLWGWKWPAAAPSLQAALSSVGSAAHWAGPSSPTARTPPPPPPAPAVQCRASLETPPAGWLGELR